MAVDGNARTPRDGSIVVTDGTGAPISYSPIRDEALTWVLNEAARVVSKTRGIRRGLRKGEDPDTDATGSWTENFAHWTDDTDGTIYDVITTDGKFAAAVTTATAGGGYDADWVLYDIAYTVEGTDHGSSADAVVTFSDCKIFMTGYSEQFPANTIGVSFECYGGVVVTGEA